jgi:hypothetical protein
VKTPVDIAGGPSIVLSSNLRTPADQARMMVDGLVALAGSIL